jgi:hypothetical protein
MPKERISPQLNDDQSKARTIISRRVSRLTLKGIFLMTMAVGMISSSIFWEGVDGPMGEGLR